MWRKKNLLNQELNCCGSTFLWIKKEGRTKNNTSVNSSVFLTCNEVEVQNFEECCIVNVSV